MANKNSNPRLIPAIIIATGLVVAAFIYAYAHRYESNSYIRIDNWTGTYKIIVER